MAYDLSNLRILVVEPGSGRRTLICDVLKAFGVSQIESEDDGRRAFAKFCKKPFDIVITERVMAPLDGLALTRMIRTHDASPAPTAPILMLTAAPSLKDVVAARDSGVTEFMIMPFSVSGLYQRIVVIIEQPRQFVRVGDYFGPDRRRAIKDFIGEDRRAEDVAALAPLARLTVD